jgi:hypothetical protein
VSLQYSGKQSFEREEVTSTTILGSSTSTLREHHEDLVSSQVITGVPNAVSSRTGDEAAVDERRAGYSKK